MKATALAVSLHVLTVTQSAVAEPVRSEDADERGFAFGAAATAGVSLQFTRKQLELSPPVSLSRSDGATVGALVFAQHQFSRILRLGVDAHGGTVMTSIGYTPVAGADVLVTLRIPTSRRVTPRLSAFVGPAWVRPPAPRGFAIDHRVAWGTAGRLGVGLGFERPFRQSAWWFLDGTLHGLSSFSHEHLATDTRTSERVAEELQYNAVTWLVVFGVGWLAR